jgi:hypothetical protein
MAVAVVTMIALGFAAEVAKRQERTNGVVRRILGTIRFHTPRDPGDEAHAHGRYVADAALANFFIWGWAAYPVGFFPPETQKYVVYSLADFVNKAVYSVMLSVSCAP